MSKFSSREKSTVSFVQSKSQRRTQLSGLLQSTMVLNVLRSTGAQAKFSICLTNDKCEQKADRAAEQVMPISDSKLRQQHDDKEQTTVQSDLISGQVTPRVQRQEGVCQEEKEVLQSRSCIDETSAVTSQMELNINKMKVGGNPLDSASSAFFEPRFGHDFSHVRVHADSAAADTAKSINARAFTLDNHVVMGAGQYQPKSSVGRRLIAHELTHVIQHNKNSVSKSIVQRQNVPQQAGAAVRRLGPIAQARSDAVAALDIAATLVGAAILARDNGQELPNNVTSALSSYFPQEAPVFLDLLLRRIQLARRVLQHIRIRGIRSVSRSDIASDPDGFLHHASIRFGRSAAAFPRSSYIAVYPGWYRVRERNLRPTRLVHEIFHYVFPSFMVGHPRNTPRANAFAYQGFVSLLGNLPTGSLVESYATEDE